MRKIRILAQAVRRLDMRMLLYMVRRVLRNRLVPRIPNTYQRRIARLEARLPKLSAPQTVSRGLAEAAEFYCAEYRAMMDGVAQGNICLHGKTIRFGSPSQIDWSRALPEEGDHQMWRVKLAHMGFVTPLVLEARPQERQFLPDLIESALGGQGSHGPDMTAPGAFNGFWFPYAASHRILALGSALLVGQAQGALDPRLRQALERILRQNVAFVLDNVEYELCNNHVERNLAALCLYFSYVAQVPDPIARRLEREIAYLLERTILPDGCQIERSPMYQGLSLVSLQIMAETPFLSPGLRAQISDMLDRARQAFAVLCHPDGEVALFNDAWHGEVPRWKGPAAPEGRSLLPDGGYGRLSYGQDLCLMDMGALGPRWNPGHGHADFLSLELTLAGQRVIVDPGTSRYNTGKDRARERSAAAHNGPVWLGHEPVEFLGCFKVGRMAQAFPVSKQQDLPGLEDLGGRIITGQFADAGRTVLRSVLAYPGQGYLIVDLWSDRSAPGQVSLLIPADWQATSGSSRVTLTQPGRQVVVQPLLAGPEPVAVTPSHWSCRYGHLQDAHELVLGPAQLDGAQQGQQALATWVGHDAAPDTASADLQRVLSALVAFL